MTSDYISNLKRMMKYSVMNVALNAHLAEPLVPRPVWGSACFMAAATCLIRAETSGLMGAELRCTMSSAAAPLRSMA